MKLNPLLKTELQKLQQNFEKNIKEIKYIFFENYQWLEWYKNEQKLIKRYWLKDSNEIIDKLVELESALSNLNSILFYDRY